MKISVISFTRAGAKKNLELAAVLQEKNHQAASYSWHAFTGRRLIPFKSFRLLLEDLWDTQEVFLFLGELEQIAGVYVPFLKEKGEGPAAVVMDEEGKFLIPFSKGRMQGLNGWCRQLAGLVGAAPVILSRGEKARRFEVDAFARKNGLYIQDLFRIQTVAEALAAGHTVGVYSDYPVEGVMPEGMVGVGAVMADPGAGEGRPPECGISITDDWEAPHFEKECRMFPENVVLGIFCREGCDALGLRQLAVSTLTGNHISKERVCAVYSSAQLAKEPAVAQLAEWLDVPFFTYDPEQLSVGDGDGAKICSRCAQLGSGDGICLVPGQGDGDMMAAVYEKKTELSF